MVVGLSFGCSLSMVSIVGWFFSRLCCCCSGWFWFPGFGFLIGLVFLLWFGVVASWVGGVVGVGWFGELVGAIAFILLVGRLGEGGFEVVGWFVFS